MAKSNTKIKYIDKMYIQVVYYIQAVTKWERRLFTAILNGILKKRS